METDIRWKQRFSNYVKALRQLERFVEKGNLNELEEQGLIQAFEFTHELAWNVMKDYFEDQGNTTITGSKDATREAFRVNLIKDGETWMEMVRSRNKSSHTYNEIIAKEIVKLVITRYAGLFAAFREKMKTFL